MRVIIRHSAKYSSTQPCATECWNKGMEIKQMANKPTRKFRLYGIEIAVWEGKTGPAYKFNRSYKDKDGQWHTTEYLGYRDLMTLHVLIARILMQPEAEEAKTAEAKKYTDPADVEYPADYEQVPF